MFYCTAEEEDMLVKQQEGSLLARQKMFVQLRQDLERVSINLSPKPISSRPFCLGKRPIYWWVIIAWGTHTESLSQARITQ